MAEEITRPSGVVLVRDSKIATLVHIRYSSTNLPDITGFIRASTQGWRTSIQLPTPDNAAEDIEVLLADYDNRFQDTLEEAIGVLEERIKDREDWFNTHNAKVAEQTARHQQEADRLFGTGSHP